MGEFPFTACLGEPAMTWTLPVNKGGVEKSGRNTTSEGAFEC